MSDDYTGAGVAEPPGETKTAPRTSVKATRNISRNGDGRSAGVERKTQGPPKSVWREYFESAVVTVIMALFGMTFVVQAVKVPTGSMQNTINIGDHLLVNKFIFAPGPLVPFLPQREIKRGDIIVFKYPGNKFDPENDRKPNNQPYKTNFVKRVIGLPGDRIEVKGDRVYINGKELPERRVTAVDHRNDAPLEIKQYPPPSGQGPYTVYYSPETRELSNQQTDLRASPDFHYAVNGLPAVVPPDSYFVMGDNRDDSLDSRAWGFVPRDLVIGRAMFVYWSYDESAPADEFPLILFLKNTRWNRTGTMVK